MEQQPRPQEPAADKGVGSVDDPTEYVPPGPPPIPDYPPAECSFPDNLWVDDAQVDPFADIPDPAEHEAIGASVTLYKVNGSPIGAKDHIIAIVPAWVTSASAAAWRRDWPLRRRNVELTFGRLIALSGDFYSNVDETYSPICGAFYGKPNGLADQEKRFESMVTALKTDFNSNLNNLTYLLDDEHKAISDTETTSDLEKLYQFSKTYHDHWFGMPTDKQFVKWTTDSKWAKFGLYPWIAYINADHFGEDAVTAYRVGHGLAIKQAIKAAGKSGKEQAEALNEAYLIEAMSCHYLTDLFSTGHLRAPRRQFHSMDWLRMYKGKSYLTQLTLISAKYVKAGLFDEGICDVMCRWCHDDDGATGLLLTNENGDQWVGYARLIRLLEGDKQLFMPQNRVNRCRSVLAVQASVDEVFKQGFLQKNEVASADFAALKQIPKPMLAVRNASWNPTGWDAYNPSPLWVAETGSVEASSWTFREAINDHSDYTRTPHTVNVVDEVSRRIKDAPFRGGDQFPNIHPMECRSGGFVQVMETGDGGRSPAGFQTVNVWGPVSVTIGDEQKSTFTLRNQIRDFEFRTDINAAVPVHFLKWFDGTATHLLQFDAVKSVDGAYGISASAYDLVNDQPDKSKQSIDFNPPQRYTISSQRTMASQELWQCPLKSYGWVNHLRIFMTTMTEGSGPTNPDIVNVSFYEKEPSKGVRIIISRTSNGFASASKKFDQTFENLESISAVPYGFAKPYRDGKHGSGIILADGQHIVGSSKVNIRLRTIFIGTDEKLSIVPYEDPLTVEQANYSWSLLVGNVFNVPEKYDQVVAVGDSFPKYSIRTYGCLPGNGMELLGSHDCEASIKKTLVCNYFTGLMPSESGNPGLDVLNISLHKDGAKYFLKFRTHRRTTESIGPGVHATHANCQDREVTDELASRYGSGAYFNIKWLRCSYGKSKNAILEIYSWYGILGTRLFAPKNNNGWEYSLVGQQPYMGQTSLGMGLGCEGDWGYGFMTWGPNEDWVDSNVWHLKPDGSNGEGNWGMTKEDYNRETVHGWEVRKRPKPVLA